MKAALVVLLAMATNNVSATVGADCSTSPTVCGDSECCGTAEKDQNYLTNNFAKDHVVRTKICNGKKETKWVETITSANANLYSPAGTGSGFAYYTWRCTTKFDIAGKPIVTGAITQTASLLALGSLMISSSLF